MEDYEITIECESPLELSHVDGGKATGFLAHMVISYLEEELQDHGAEDE